MATTSMMTMPTLKTTSSSLRRGSTRRGIFKACCSLEKPRVEGHTLSLVDQFDPRIAIEEAVTPPSSWYTDPSFYDLELHRVFYRGWQLVGCAQQIKDPRDFFTGRLGNVEYLVCRDENGKLHAFHNVCRHHASILAHGSGKKSCFVCPYHGWTYGLDGPLLKATRMTGIQNFNVNEFGLVPIHVATWGPFVLLNMEQEVEGDVDAVADEWLGSCSEVLSNNGVDTSLSYICRREYTIGCNWKIFEKVSIQKCEGGSVEGKNDYDRLGSTALYAFVYPNFMINRYGPWMDTNLVLPLGPKKCKVVFDYFLEPSLKDDKAFIERSLQDSERVQMEDVILCEGVQRGLESPAYSVGRYAPNVENAMHHFHCLLHSGLTK